MVDRQVFTEWMGELDEHFPGSRSERILRVYWRQISDKLTTEAFEAACVQILGENDFFPKWTDFVPERSEEEIKAEALEQWEVVRAAMSNSRDPLPEETTEETRRVVKLLGGLPKLGQTPLDEIQWVEKRFMEHYGTMAEKGEREQLPPMTDQGRELVEDAMAGRLGRGG